MKPRNYVAKAQQSGAGKHADKREKQERELRQLLEKLRTPANIDKIKHILGGEDV